MAKKIISGGKVTLLYDHRIKFRGQLYDYIFIVITIAFVVGFLLLQYP